MQDIIVEKPYEFIAPRRGNLIPSIIQRFRLFDCYLAKYEGVTSHEVHGAEQLNESLRQGHGVILAPNHCRYADPLAMGWVAREARTHLFAMASWHLFHKSRFQTWAMRAIGGFSIFREGLDRQSLETAIEILVRAERPLIIFPEGVVFRTNDLLHPLLDGVAFLARTAARRRAKQDGGRVVIHPIAIKYLFLGDLKKSVDPVLESIERRLTWAPDDKRDLLDRIARIGDALLTLKEIEHLGGAQHGSIHQRQMRLIDHLLQPLETKWLGAHQTAALIPRIKQLRMKIVPNLTGGNISAERRTEVWRDLAAIYLAQQIGSYPHDYLRTPTTVTRILEMVERFEEDLVDRSRVHKPIHVVIEVGAAINIEQDKPHRNEEDPLMLRLRNSLEEMLARLAPLATVYQPD